jgi:hypothetical protein
VHLARAELGLLRNARGEPDWVGIRIADEEYGAVADGRRRRDQHIVDLEVAIWRECNASTIRAVLGKGCHGSQISVAKTLALALKPI